MSHIWGLHDMSVHRDNGFWAWVESMQFRSIKLFEWSWSNRDYCENLRAVLPADCIWVLRDHPLSEQKGDMLQDPAGTGIRHANEWAQKWNGGRIFAPRERSIHLGLNETNTNEYAEQHAIYEENYAIHLRRQGLRGGLGSFGVGHPRTIDKTPNTARAWQIYNSIRDLLLAEDFHKLIVHEYAGHNEYGWGWLIGGFVFGCPWPLHDGQVIYGEIGIDEFAVGAETNIGFQHFLSMEQYISWLQPVHSVLTADPRTHSAQIFTYDFFKPWASFSYHQPEMRCLMTPDNWYSWDEEVLWNTRTETPVRVNYLDGKRYPDEHRPEVIYIPTMNSDSETFWDHYPENFVRAMRYILNIEGGLSNHPLDRGGLTNFGISKNANPDVDVEHLTLPEAVYLYYTRYWLPSGAGEYMWPTCYAIMDAAVQHGVGSATWLWNQAQKDLGAFTASRLRLYNKQSEEQWNAFGHGWIERMAQVIERTV